MYYALRSVTVQVYIFSYYLKKSFIAQIRCYVIDSYYYCYELAVKLRYIANENFILWRTLWISLYFLGGTFPIQCVSGPLYFCVWTSLWALFHLVVIALQFYFTDDHPYPKWLSYLTNWGYTLVALHSVWDCACTLYVNLRLKTGMILF